jgi:hypothetical protein
MRRTHKPDGKGLRSQEVGNQQKEQWTGHAAIKRDPF